MSARLAASRRGDLVEDQRRGHLGQLGQRPAPRRVPRRQEPREQEAVGRQPGHRQRGQQRRGPRHRHHRGARRRSPRPPAGSRDRRPAACRRPRPAPPTGPRPAPPAAAAAAPRRCGRGRAGVGRPGPPHAVDVEQLPRLPGVLGGEDVGRGQDVERAQGDVARRPDRRRHQVEPGREPRRRSVAGRASGPSSHSSFTFRDPNRSFRPPPSADRQAPEGSGARLMLSTRFSRRRAVAPPSLAPRPFSRSPPAPSGRLAGHRRHRGRRQPAGARRAARAARLARPDAAAHRPRPRQRGAARPGRRAGRRDRPAIYPGGSSEGGAAAAQHAITEGATILVGPLLSTETAGAQAPVALGRRSTC